MGDTEPSLTKGAVRWAWAAAWRWLNTFLAGSVAVTLAVSAVGAIFVANVQSSASGAERVVKVTASAAVGMVAVAGGTFIAALIAAPMQQRNKLRSRVQTLTQALDASRFSLIMANPLFDWTVLVPWNGASSGTLKWGFGLNNDGDVPLALTVESVTGHLGSSAVPDAPGGVTSLIFPGQRMVVWGPRLQGFPAAPDQITGELQFSILYGPADTEPRFRLRHRLTFTRNRTPSGGYIIETRDADGPHYDIL